MVSPGAPVATVGSSSGIGGFNDLCRAEFGEASYFCTCQQAANQPNILDITGGGAWCRHVSAGSGLTYNSLTDTYIAYSNDVTGVSDFHESDAGLGLLGFINAVAAANLDCSGWEHSADVVGSNFVHGTHISDGFFDKQGCGSADPVLCCGRTE